MVITKLYNYSHDDIVYNIETTQLHSYIIMTTTRSVILYRFHRMFALLLMLVCSSTVYAGSGGTYFVKPNSPSTTCPSQPCYTLEYYVQSVPELFTQSNVTLNFLSGVHLLHHLVKIKHVENFTMIGAEDRIANTDPWKIPIPSSEIMCQGSVGLKIGLSRNVSIKSLTFSNCGAIVVYKVKWLYKAALLIENVTDLSISRIVVQNSTGYGLFGTNILGESILTQSTFMFNRGDQTYYGGNVRINYYDCLQAKNKSTLLIGSSRFLHGYDPHNDHQSTASGLTVFIGVKCSHVAISIDNITASDNEALDGGNIALLYKSDNITNSGVLSNSWITNGYGRGGGGGVNIWTDSADSGAPGKQECDPNGIMKIHNVFRLTNVTFVNNTGNISGGAINVGHNKLRVVCFIRVLTFQNCVLIGSQSSLLGHAVAVYIFSNPLSILASNLSPQFETRFINCSFTNSAPTSNCNPELALRGCAVYLDDRSAIRTTVNNCTFKDGIGSAIRASSSNIIFHGNSFFTNNSAANGGALSLGGQTLVVLQNDTHIYFNNNRAKYAGGAVYSSVEGCFLYHGKSKDVNITITFQNNTANYAGTAVFFAIGSPVCDLNHVKNTQFDRSLVSSTAKGVCFCNDNVLDCGKRVLQVELYPGETFVIPATTVGSRNGTVPGAIRASVSGANTHIESFQRSQAVTDFRKCVNLNFTGYSDTYQSAVLKLTAEMVLADINPSTMQVHLKFKRCPLGFVLMTVNGSFCGCIDTLKQVGVTCDISKNAIFRPGGVWIGYVNNSVEGSGVVAHPHCPFDFCKANRNNMSLSDVDQQCNYNRSGVLCGACKNGLSLALGTSQCTKCSDMFLILLIAFAFAGVVLVFLLFTCNLTVSEGPMNGLIFYANILWVNKSIFFPPGTSANVLTVFLAWLNLDLGIPVCLYEGMDAYTRTWLQFAFPVYIWALVGLIVLLSRRFTWITKLIGTNAVKVLATLFLLSFTKLQRTVIAVLSFTYITLPNGSRKYVWLYDGNVDYGEGKHILLLVAAAAVLIILSIPYVLVLLLIQCLRAVSSDRVCSWVHRLKPLLDAYAGPYKLKYPFWTGFLLLVRSALFLVFAFNYVDEPSLNLMAIVIASLFVLMFAWSLGGVYKKWPLDILESSFVLNFGVFAAATLYIKFQQRNQAAVFYISTGVAFTTFTGIVIYHLGRRLHAWEKLQDTCAEKCFKTKLHDQEIDSFITHMDEGQNDVSVNQN